MSNQKPNEVDFSTTLVGAFGLIGLALIVLILIAGLFGGFATDGSVEESESNEIVESVAEETPDDSDTTEEVAILPTATEVEEIVEPTVAPDDPTEAPTEEPTEAIVEPTEVPDEPTEEPTDEPTEEAIEPTEAPTEEVVEPTDVVEEPSEEPTAVAVAADADDDSGETTGDAPDAARVYLGEAKYMTCIGCHGDDARGLPNLGKDLVDTEFMQTTSDEDLFTLIKNGRPLWDTANTTGIDMPARGGNPALTDEDIFDIIAYIRSLQSGAPQPTVVETTDEEPESTEVPDEPTEEPTIEPTEAPTEEVVEPTDVVEEPSEESTAVAVAADADDDSGETTSDAPDAARVYLGEAKYMTCVGCHGADARGLPNLGKDLVDTEFMQTTSDEDLFTLIKNGRPLWDTANTTGIDMPARGGNPALTDEDIFDIIAYIRSLQSG